MYVFFSLSLVGYAGTQKPDLLEPPTRQRAESELELKQAHMAQKPVLRVEVGARALRVRSVSRGKAPWQLPFGRPHLLR